MVEQSSDFEYPALTGPDSIRLIILHEGCGSDPVICSLFESELESTEYEALSYEWGAFSTEDPDIFVNDSTLNVRRNLCEALMHIRSETESRVVWIDALCIDQSDGQERNHQVQMMGKIYEGARQVIIWLGVAADDSDLAIDAYQRVRDNELNNFARQRLEQPELEALVKFCNRTYWYRVWIRQEMKLAQRYVVHCGSRCLNEEDLGELFLTLERIRSQCDVSLESLVKQLEKSIVSELILLRRMPSTMTTLYRLIMSCIRWNCVSSEPRDYIYAMLGMACDCKNGEMVCDYQRPLLEVYLDAIVIMCKPGFWERSVSIKSPTQWNKTTDDLAQSLGIVVDDDLRRLRSETVLASLASAVGTDT